MFEIKINELVDFIKICLKKRQKKNIYVFLMCIVFQKVLKINHLKST